jgi:hypothetical protein
MAPSGSGRLGAAGCADRIAAEIANAAAHTRLAERREVIGPPGGHNAADAHKEHIFAVKKSLFTRAL